MKISTVCGEISADDLGITLPHEHLLLNLPMQAVEVTDPYLREIAARPVDSSIVADLRLAQMISKDSLCLTDVNMAIEELSHFKAAGGQSLVDQSSRSCGADPPNVKKISEATGVNIIMVASYYEIPPEQITKYTLDQLADALVKEVTDGFEGTDIKAGMIGEILTSWPLKPAEEKALRAAARAQARTGAPLSIHPSPWDKEALALLDIVESEGADLRRVVICHLDHMIDVEYPKLWLREALMSSMIGSGSTDTADIRNTT